MKTIVQILVGAVVLLFYVVYKDEQEFGKLQKVVQQLELRVYSHTP